MYQTLRQKYKEGSEERKQIDREIYTRLKTIYDAQISYIDGVTTKQADADKELLALKTTYDSDYKKAGEDADANYASLQKKYKDDVADAQADADKKLLSENTSYQKSLTSILDNAEADRQNIRDQYASDQKEIKTFLITCIFG